MYLKTAVYEKSNFVFYEFNYFEKLYEKVYLKKFSF